MKKKMMMIALTGGLLFSVTACNGVGAANSGTAAKTVVTTTSSTTSGTSVTTDSSTTGSTTTTASSGTSSSTATGTVKADMFTDRDKDASYDESSATKVNLSEIKDSTYTITKEGVYILSGTYSGQIIVNVADTAKVQLVLDGVTITNESTAAIYVKEADKVFVTLKDGTTSTLTTSGTFVATDDNNVDGVIFSKGDLTINGSGSLKISSSAHGIVGKDDVVITGGNIDITSTKKGISGKDSVRIADGTINITTGTDGIHSENSDDTSNGFVYIEGGTITINAADDGIHAGTNLDIVGGKIDITQSNEGLEGKDVNIIAVGTMLNKAIKASEILKEQGIDAKVCSASVLKPFDDSIINSSDKLIVTLEDNLIRGGFGEYIAANYTNMVVNLGWPDKFIEHGDCEYLYKKYGLDAESIAERIRQELEGKA